MSAKTVCYNKDSNAAEAHEDIFAVYGEDASL